MFYCFVHGLFRKRSPRSQWRSFLDRIPRKISRERNKRTKAQQGSTIPWSNNALPVERRAVYGPCVRLIVEGLQGGHSGVEIHKNRANANKVMGEFLSRVQKLMPLCITKLSGGAKENAIPRSCEVTLVALGMYIERINDIAAQLQREIREQFDEPEVIVRGDDVDALGGNALTTECTSKVIALLNSVPNGVQAWSKDIEGLVQTSLNLGIASVERTWNFICEILKAI